MLIPVQCASLHALASASSGQTKRMRMRQREQHARFAMVQASSERHARKKDEIAIALCRGVATPPQRRLTSAPRKCILNTVGAWWQRHIHRTQMSGPRIRSVNLSCRPCAHERRWLRYWGRRNPKSKRVRSPSSQGQQAMGNSRRKLRGALKRACAPYRIDIQRSSEG